MNLILQKPYFCIWMTVFLSYFCPIFSTLSLSFEIRIPLHHQSQFFLIEKKWKDQKHQIFFSLPQSEKSQGNILQNFCILSFYLILFIARERKRKKKCLLIFLLNISFFVNIKFWNIVIKWRLLFFICPIEIGNWKFWNWKILIN